MRRIALLLTGILFAPTGMANIAGPDYAAFCRSVDDGTACNAVRRGINDFASGLSWRYLGKESQWQDAAATCRKQLGEGWRLPSLAELDSALDRSAFGYCSLKVWTGTLAGDGQSAWHWGIAYEGEPRCTVDTNGRQACVGGCGPYWMQRDAAPVTSSLGVLCVKQKE